MTEFQHPHPIDILLVEDNPGDVELTRDAFEDVKIANRIYVARDGEEALEFLHQQGIYANASIPDLIILDLNMPGMSGKEFLSIIKGDDGLKHIPVIVLTSSEADMDVLKSYELHASAYIVKPVTLPKFIDVVEAVEKFWLTVVRLPPRNNKRRHVA